MSVKLTGRTCDVTWRRAAGDLWKGHVLRDRDLREFHLERATAVAPAVVKRLA